MVTASLLTFVPDAQIDLIGADTDLRDTLEFDSLDFLSFVEQLGRRSGRRIDEDDYDHRARWTHAFDTCASGPRLSGGLGVQPGSPTGPHPGAAESRRDREPDARAA